MKSLGKKGKRSKNKECPEKEQKARKSKRQGKEDPDESGFWWSPQLRLGPSIQSLDISPNGKVALGTVGSHVAVELKFWNIEDRLVLCLLKTLTPPSVPRVLALVGCSSVFLS